MGEKKGGKNNKADSLLNDVITFAVIKYAERKRNINISVSREKWTK
jgi:hypothetical protein